MNDLTYLVSKNGLKKLESKYDSLIKQEKEIQNQIGESVKMDNDLRENPDYMLLQSKAMTEMKYQLDKVKQVLRDVRLIENEATFIKANNSKVYIGSKVKVLHEDNEVETYIILGYDETDLEKGIISYLSPLGKALLNKELGEKFLYVNNDYHEEIEILSIQRWENLK